MRIHLNSFQHLTIFLYGLLFYVFWVAGGLRWMIIMAVCIGLCLMLYFYEFIRHTRRSIAEVRMSQDEFFSSIDFFLRPAVISAGELEGQECVICLEDLSESRFGEPVSIRCSCAGCFYHKTCITKWLLKKSTCPVCRRDLKSKTTL